jgi:hypothetical protein
MGFIRTVSTSSDGADREAAEVRLAEALVLALRRGKAAADLPELLEQHGSPVHVRSAALPQGRWTTAVSTRSLPGSPTTSSSSVAEQICPRLTPFWRAAAQHRRAGRVPGLLCGLARACAAPGRGRPGGHGGAAVARGGGRALPSRGRQEQVSWSGHTPCSLQGAGFLGKQLGAARALHDSA